jgi:tetratricopeptide (TPR) repeat protein
VNKIFKTTTAILAFLTITALVHSQSEGILDRAIKEYLRGDYIGAITDFDRVLEMDPANDKAQTLLYKSLVEEGKRNYDNGKLAVAKPYLERAVGLNPSDREVSGILRDINNKISSKDKSKKNNKVAVEVLQEKVARERKQKTSYRNQLGSLKTQRDRLKGELSAYKTKLQESQTEIEKLADDAGKRQKTLTLLIVVGAVTFVVFAIIFIIVLLRVFAASNASRYQLEELQDQFEKRMQDSEKEGDALEERVARSINTMIDGQKDVVKRVSLSAAGKTHSDIELIKDMLEKHLEGQQSTLVELLNQHAQALSSEKTEKVEVEGRVITDVNPHVRARADSVELIPKTISDPHVAEKVLRPYLKDPNNRVRGNAVVAIHQYNPTAAVEALGKMAESPDKWMRLSAAWAAGVIANPETVTIIRKLLDDVEERVRERAIKAFEGMAEVKTDVADEIRKMMKRDERNDV